MKIRKTISMMAHRLWTRAVRFCEAKTKILAAQKRAKEAAESVVAARQKAEKDIADAETRAGGDIDVANRNKVEAERSSEKTRRALDELQRRIDAAAAPIAKNLIAKAKTDAKAAIRKVDRRNSFAKSSISKIQEKIEFYENETDEFQLTLEDVEGLREMFENKFFNTERKLDAVQETLDDWMNSFREQVDEDKKFIDRLSEKLS